MAAQQHRPKIIVPFTRPVQYESHSFAYTITVYGVLWHVLRQH